MNRSIPSLALAFVLLAACPVGRSQSVHWDPPGGALPVGQASQVRLLFDGCSPKETPIPPTLDSLALHYTGQGSRIVMDNGSVSQSVEVDFSAMLSDRQSVEIPSFSVETDKGTLQVAAVRFDPASSSTLGSTGVPVENVAEAHLTTVEPSAWAGEVFGLRYSIEADRSFNPDYGQPGLPNWNPSPLLAEDWGTPAPYQSDHGGEPRVGLRTQARAIARNPGRYTLGPAHQLVNFNVSVGGFGFFAMRQIEQVQVPAQGPTIEIRPLPPAPAGFDGAVGSFHVTSRITPRQVAVGDPITWTVELSGTGNWPDIRSLPSRNVSSDFRAIQPRPRRTQSSGKLFDAALSEDVILIPSRAGTYTLPDVPFVAFNPKSGSYETLTAPGDTVTVTAPAAAAAGTNPPAEGGPGPSAQAGGSSPAAPTPPGPIPHDPIDASGNAPLPRAGADLGIASGAILAAVAGLWAVLALIRARRTDPLTPRRLARRRLALILGRLGSAPAADVPELLRQWQAHAAILAGLPPCTAGGGQLGDEAWSRLWSEADRALFGAGSPLPGDWAARAQGALASRRLPALRWIRLFHRRNLFPAAIAALIVLCAGPSVRAEGPAALAYRGGDFRAAEAASRKAVAANPADWAARNDLALALAQQDRWGEAAAEAAAAYVQHPCDSRVRHTLALTCTGAGFEPDALAAFLDNRPLEKAAGLASAPEWQRVILASAGLVGVALALLLLRAYGLIRRRGPGLAALALTLLAVLAAAAGWIGWDAYGVAADARAAIVWRTGILRSVPTEADVTQKTTPLDAGNVGLIDRRFIGWVRLSFPNGESGWVRSEEALPLWR